MIGVGLALPQLALRRGWGGGVAWTPAALFADGGEGVWLDSSDLSTVFQDAAGTTPAGVGDPVGLIEDKSGNGHHASQSVASARAILRQTADGKYYLDFDGVDDYLSLGNDPAFDFTSDFVFAAGLYDSGAAGGFRAVAGKYSAGAQEGWDVALQNGFPRVTVRGTSNIDTGSGGFTESALGAARVLVAEAGTSAISRTWNENTVNTAGTWSPVTSSQEMTIGRRGSENGNYYQGHVYGVVVVGKAISAPDRQRLEQYLANQAGVTLP